MTIDIAIAPLGSAHADAAFGLTTAVGWSHRRDDWLFALSIGRGLGAFDAAGTLRGTLMWFPYGAAHASIGMITVDPTLQRSGIGRALMQRLFDRAGDRSLLLVSTDAGRRLYESLGFQTIGTNAAHIGKIAAPDLPHDDVKPAQPGDLPALRALDAAAMGCRRDALIDGLSTVGDVAVVRRRDHIIGFSACRRFGAGRVIGPVVANGIDVARHFVAYWLARYPGETLRIDIPAEHADLADWVTAQGLPRGAASPIMLRGDAPKSATPWRRYALVSQAMG